MTSGEQSHKSRQLEDPLAYLPYKGLVEYRPNQNIYDEQHPPRGVYLILQGRVKVATASERGSQCVTGIFGVDELFGTVSLVNDFPPTREQATAMEKSTLMMWPRAEVEAEIERHPALDLAMIQILVGRCVDFEDRLQSLALDKIPKRLAIALIRLAGSGMRDRDGAARIPPLTHDVLAGYIGTSREIVTSEMNHLRRLGALRYSRKSIEIYPDALRDALATQHRGLIEKELRVTTKR